MCTESIVLSMFLFEATTPGDHLFMVHSSTIFFFLFSKRRFAEQQAEEWWRENQERVFKKYNHPTN